MKKNYNYTIILFAACSLLFSIEVTTQKLVMSFDSPYSVNLTINQLLEFEKIGIEIKNIRERHQFYRSVSNKINQAISEIEFSSGIMEIKLRDFIYEYEEKINRDHFYFHTSPPKFKYIYSPLALDQDGINKNVFFKEAAILKSQYIQLYNYYRRNLQKYRDYLFSLREEHFYNDPSNGELVIFNDDEFEELFYQNVQELLRENLLFQDEEIIEFMRIYRDFEDRVVSMNWFTDTDSLIKSRDFTYLENGLLGIVIERVSGVIVKETIYGQNQYSKEYYDYVFSSGFLPTNYDHMTEIYYGSEMIIESINFLKLNGDKIGSIEYNYNQYGHLVNEIWRKGNLDQLIREFVCDYDEGIEGSYKIREKDKYGRTVYQDVVTSLVEEKIKREIKE